MAEQNQAQEAPEKDQAGQPAKDVKKNKDGFIPGQRVTAKELAAYRQKQRKSAKK